MPEILGFAPDLDPRTPGAILDGLSFVPTIRGIAGAPAPMDIGVAALDAPCLGAASIRILSGGRRTIAGTAAKLQELSGTTWTDRSKVGGYATGGGRWRYTQFGDVTIATNRTDPMQASNPGGAFADLAGTPPKARFLDTVGLFVIAADTTEATFGDQPDRWWCSALGNHASWVPSIATQAATGRLLDSEGPITGSRGLGNSWVLYKKNAIYVGNYVGGDVIWAFERVPGQAGCVAHDSIVNLQSAHIFRGSDDFYVFDGNRVEPIGRRIKEFFSSDISVSFGDRILALHDKPNTLVYFFYPSTASSGSPDSGVVYNYESRKWGVHDLNVQAITEHIAGALTWDNLGTIASTWNDFPAIAYDDPFWVSGSEAPAIFDTTNKLVTLSGTPGTASISTWEIGDLGRYTGISRVNPRFRSNIPTAGTMTGRYATRQNRAFSSSGQIPLVGGRFSYLRDAVLHKFEMSFTGRFELVDIDIEARPGPYE